MNRLFLLPLLFYQTALSQRIPSTTDPWFNAQNTQYFNYSNNYATFGIPSTSKTVYIEMWGGGGAGGILTGGQGGAYICLQIDPSKLNMKSIQIKVGKGGSNNDGNGEATTVSVGSVKATAMGGGSTDNPRSDGTYKIEGNDTMILKGYTAGIGEFGQRTQFSDASVMKSNGDTMSYFVVVKAGGGGSSGKHDNTGGGGGSCIKKSETISGNNTYIQQIRPQNGHFPGGGGGAIAPAAVNILLDGPLGANGGNGLVIIHY